MRNIVFGFRYKLKDTIREGIIRTTNSAVIVYDSKGAFPDVPLSLVDNIHRITGNLLRDPYWQKKATDAYLLDGITELSLLSGKGKYYSKSSHAVVMFIWAMFEDTICVTVCEDKVPDEEMATIATIAQQQCLIALNKAPRYLTTRVIR